MDLIVMIFCSYQLHRMAVERGLSPWRYIGQYVGLFFLMCFIAMYGLMLAFGKDFMQNEDALNKIIYFSPFAILFEILTFIWFRKRIANADVYDDDDQDDTPPPSDGKKDLSYFR